MARIGQRCILNDTSKTMAGSDMACFARQSALFQAKISACFTLLLIPGLAPGVSETAAGIGERARKEHQPGVPN